MSEEQLLLLNPGTSIGAPPRLLGRDYEVMAAEEILATASVQIVGMPGSGVTTMLNAIVHRFVEIGRTVLRVPVLPWSATPVSLLTQVDALLPHLEAPIVVVDDAHLADHDDLTRLVEVVESMGGRVLLGVHPGEMADVDIVHLPGLSRDAVRQFLTEALGRPLELSDEYLVAALSRTTRGHVSHLLALLEPDVLGPLADLAQQVQDLDGLREAFSDSLSTDTRTRLEQLDEQTQLAVAILAVAGNHTPGLLIDVAAGTEQLQDLRRRGLIERTPDSHKFRNAAVRDLIRRSAPNDLVAEARWRLAVAAQAAGFTTAPPGVFPARDTAS